MEFMREGGFGMWLTLAFFLVGVGVAVARRRRDGDRVAYGASLAVLASGLLGLSTGLWATVAYVTHVAAAERADVLAIGIRESANNTVLAAALGLALAALGLALGRRPGAPAAA